MDLWAMAVIAAAITFERLSGRHAARLIGVIVLGVGMYLIGRAVL
jgi:hypothetical protein